MNKYREVPPLSRWHSKRSSFYSHLMQPTNRPCAASWWNIRLASHHVSRRESGGGVKSTPLWHLKCMKHMDTPLVALSPSPFIKLLRIFVMAIDFSYSVKAVTLHHRASYLASLWIWFENEEGPTEEAMLRMTSSFFLAWAWRWTLWLCNSSLL